jgi:hypothetical protein
MEAVIIVSDVGLWVASFTGADENAGALFFSEIQASKIRWPGRNLESQVFDDSRRTRQSVVVIHLNSALCAAVCNPAILL